MFNPGIAVEIKVHVFLGLVPTDTELLAQTEGGHAIHQAEVNGLRRTSVVDRDSVRVQLEYLGCSCRMHVAVIAEGGKQTLVPGQVRHDAQLDLGIVRSEQNGAVGGHECLANLAAFGRTNRDVLQIGVG